MKKENINEIEAYTTLLMKCVSDINCFDEGLINYLINYKSDIIEKENFKKRENGLVICSDLWGYIKTNTSESYKEKWSKILKKDINDSGKFLYLKFNFNDYDKRNKKIKYDPLFEQSKEKYHRVSEDFLHLISNSSVIRENEIDAKKLTEIELQLIINDLLNDNNLNYVKFEKQESLIKVLQNYIISNFREMNELSNEKKKKGLLRTFSLGNNTINYIFQTIDKEDRNNLIEKYNIEDKLLGYMRYKVINKDYFLDLLSTYKDKNFWIKNLNCYDKVKNEFSIQNAIRDIIDINKSLDFYYKDSTKFNEFSTKITYEYTEGDYGNKNEKIMGVIKFFEKELKGAINYKEEIEKMMILAIWNESRELYKLANEIRKDEKGNIENIELNHPLLKKIYKIKENFMLEMKKEESKELKDKIEKKLETQEENNIKRMKI